MKSFCPENIYERGRREDLARQPEYYERFRKLIPTGLAFCVEEAGGRYWFACGPDARLEPGVFFAHDLAKNGEAAVRRIEFELVTFFYAAPLTRGSLIVGGWGVAHFRPLPEAEDEALVAIWNSRSGCPPLQLVEF